MNISSPDTYFSKDNNSINYVLPDKKSLIYINKNFTNIGLVPKLTLELQNKKNNQKLAGPVILQSQE
jgi:hypothetical protein